VYHLNQSLTGGKYISEGGLSAEVKISTKRSGCEREQNPFDSSLVLWYDIVNDERSKKMCGFLVVVLILFILCD